MTFGGTSAILKAPGNNNTLNWFGPGPIPVQKGNSVNGYWFGSSDKNVGPTICNFTNTAKPIVTTQCFAQPGAENGGQPEFGNLLTRA